MSEPFQRQEQEAVAEAFNSVQSRADKQPYGEFALGVVDSAPYQAGIIFSVGNAIESIPPWSIYPAMRDRMLRVFYKTEPVIAGAVYAMEARLKSLRWSVSGEDEDLRDQTEVMLNAADFGHGLRALIGRTVIDLATQDNGFFWELIGAGNPDGALVGPVQAVNYLDSQQCYRTYDPDYPVLYIDPIDGSRHRLHRTRVVMGASMEQPKETARGVGLCPLSRALLNVQLAKSISEYRYEKISGNFERAIGYGSGMTQRTLEDLLAQSQLSDEASGFVRFGRIPFYVSPRQDVSLNILDLASLPDGFDLMSEIELYVNIVALCFGVDTREIWPATMTGATKADAEVQHLKSQGKGLADLITIIEDALNRYVVPASVTFEFQFVDEEADRQRAEQNRATIDSYVRLQAAGVLSARQVQALLIHQGIIDADVLRAADSLVVMDEGDPVAQAPPDAAEDAEEDAEERMLNFKQAARNIVIKTASQYRASLRAAIRGYMTDEFSQVGFVQAYDAAIRRGFESAFAEGAAKGGINRNEYSEAEINRLQALIAEEQSYVLPFAQRLKAMKENGASVSSGLDQAGRWANRYERIAAIGLMMANGNKKLKWVADLSKENCIDCLKLNGRVYRAEVWDRYGIAPRDSALACGGYNCGCDLEETDEPLTRGRPPTISGRRMRVDAQRWIAAIQSISPAAKAVLYG